MDVFLFGLLRTIRAVLPHMRDQRSGKIINMSSSAATLALPFVGFYSAGKYAMAGLSESLRREMMGFNIWVSYLEASAFRTNAADEVIVAADRIEDYSPLRDNAIHDFQQAIRSGKDPKMVAKTVEKIIKTKKPKLLYRVDSQAKMLPLLKAFTPRRAQDVVFEGYAKARGG